MADFPALAPASRPLTPGAWGGTDVPALSGGVSTVRQGSAEIGRRLSLTFPAITEAQFLQLLSHYRGQRSGFDSFAFTTTTIPSSYTPAGHQWLYAGLPQVVDQHTDVFDVACEFRSEPRAIFRAPGVAFVQQPALAAGSMLPTIGGGAFAPTPSLATGSPTTIIGGAAFAPAADPEMSLQLHFAGANDSTTFTDSSGYKLITSAVVNAKISTAQSKFGGSSGLFANLSSYIRFTPQTSLQLTGDFTIEAQLYPLSSVDMTAASSSSDSNTQIFRLNEGGSGRLSFYLNGTQVFSATAAGITANAWQHVCICRSGSSTRMFVNGTQVGSTNTNWTGSFRIDVIGAFFFNGSYFNAGFNGYIDELRVLKRAERTANFTAPAAAYSDPLAAALTPGAPV
jgi:hypothetical protein